VNVSGSPALSGARAARSALSPHLRVTPVERPTGPPPCTFKCEFRQQTGSFKPRGALWFALNRPETDRGRGLVTVSAGNHALGTAYAARRLGVPAVVCLFEGASPWKAAAARDLGAEVRILPDVAAAFAEADRLAREEPFTFVHPFDHPRTIEGQATLTMEILEQVPDVDLIVTGVGGGGLLAGAALALSDRPDVRLVAVEPESAATLTAAIAAGKPVTLPKSATIADGLAPPYVGGLNYEIVKDRVEAVITVDDDVIRRGMKALHETEGFMVEPAGAAAFGAFLAGLVPGRAARHPVVVLSGGNVAPEVFQAEIAKA